MSGALLLGSLLAIGCERQDEGGITYPGFSYTFQLDESPYRNPIWHPQGNIIGFNHTPTQFIIDYRPFNYSGEIPVTVSIDSTSSGFFLINTDRTGKKRLLPNTLNTPSWSHSGQYIAFSDDGICVMPFDGEEFDTTRIVRLTHGEDMNPAWSFDDEWIAYDSNTGEEFGKRDIWKVKVDGSERHLLTTSDVEEARQPFWSIDTTILHERYDSQGNCEIFVMDANGGNVLKVGDGYMPRYSPDGRYLSYLTANGGLMIKEIDSGRVSSFPWCDNYSWSPNNSIVFVYNQPNETSGELRLTGNLIIMEDDGEIQALTQHEIIEYFR